MNGLPDISQWWRAVEAPGPLPGDWPPWMVRLAGAARAEVEFRIDDARASLAALQGRLDGPWRDVARLVELRLDVRECHGDRLAESLARIAGFADALAGGERATLARAWHLMGTASLRANRLDEAETALARALEAVEEGPARNWVLDGFGQVFTGQGAWEEARRTLAAVARRKQAAGDFLGVAITAGHLALLELKLGNAAAGARTARQALEACAAHLAPNSRIRLRTLLLEGLLEAPDSVEAARQADLLAAELAGAGEHRHYLKGFACAALARAAAARGDRAGCRGWLDRARHQITMPDQMALLRAWEAQLLPDAADQPDWWRSTGEIFAAAGDVAEAEVMLSLHMARSAAASGKPHAAGEHLDRAMARAVASNNRLLLAQVDRVYEEIDPRGMARRLAERFCGCPLEQLRRTTREEATVVFADLVGFTPRSLELAPDEVMSTVRSVFELAVPLLAAHRVRPLSYLGDGLLAAAQGDDHRARGVAFARGMVRKASLASMVRSALGEKWGLHMRAGVASGTVVMGALGSHFKMEFAAIGLTTNLAARLQGAAGPGEVVVQACDDDKAAETLTLKGFDRPVAVIRIPAER